MSKIRMAILKDCTVIGVAWLDKSGVGQAIKINIPTRKQAIIRRALTEGMDFPKAPAKEASKLILPAAVLNAQDAEKAGKSIIAEY